jgi:iron complex transport system ATP-binding protein
LAHDAKGKTLISITDLSLELDTGQFALNKITTSFENSRIHALVGPNGSGKTTLLKSLVGLYKAPRQDCIKIEPSRSLQNSNNNESRVISYVESQHLAAFAFPVRDIILWGRWNLHRGRPTAEDFEHVEASANLVGISDLLDRPFTKLSTGERKKTMLAQSFASSAKFFIWDEPFAPLDLKSLRKILATIKNLKATGATFIISFHDMPLALRHADTLTILEQGMLKWTGLTSQKDAVTALEQVFGTPSNTGGIFFV